MTHCSARPRRRAGQTLPIVVWIVAIVVVMLVVVFDIFYTARSKMFLFNSADSAALAAARWQGITLNMIGDVNLAHLAAAIDQSLSPTDRTNVIVGVNAIAERLAFAGPMMGLYAANECVRLNYEANNAHRLDKTVPPDPDLSDVMRLEIDYIRQYQNELPNTDSWPTKVSDYLNMVETVFNAGVFVGIDNAQTFSGSIRGAHIYYQPGFYQAAQPNVSKRWFCLRNRCRHTLGEDAAHDPTSDDLAATPHVSFQNSGFLGVGVEFRRMPLSDVSPDADMTLVRLWNDYGGSPALTLDQLQESGLIDDTYFGWYFLSSKWRRWTELAQDRSGNRPLVGTVRPEFDVYGAMAAARVRRDMITLAGVETNSVELTAYAKPFGELPWKARVTDVFGTWTPPPDPFDTFLLPLVLPAYSFVRLVPCDAVPEEELNRANVAWIWHCAKHLSMNTRDGACRYCKICTNWENGWRELAMQWFKDYDHNTSCIPLGSGGYVPKPTRGNN